MSANVGDAGLENVDQVEQPEQEQQNVPAPADDDHANSLAAGLQRMQLSRSIQAAKFTAKEFTGAADQDKAFHIEYLHLRLMNAEVPESKWAALAAGSCSPEVLQSLYSVGITADVLKTMSWQEFKTAFLALPIGSTQLNKVAIRPRLALLRRLPHQPAGAGRCV
jgi:hypothetical protein